MMQRFALLILVASVALLGSVVPVDAKLAKRETNARRFARNLGPLPPVKRSPTDTANRRQVSQRAVTSRQSTTSGTLQVQERGSQTVLGWVIDNANGPTGINLANNNSPTDPNVIVDFDSTADTLFAQDATFSPPYIGGQGTDILTNQNLATLVFTNVGEGPAASIWTLDPNTSMLYATWTNSDNTTVPLTLMYDSGANVLSFTANPLGIQAAQSSVTSVDLYIAT